MSYLRRCGARRVVYVSCNAATQARDLQLLCAAMPPKLRDKRNLGRCDMGALLRVTLQIGSRARGRCIFGACINEQGASQR